MVTRPVKPDIVQAPFTNDQVTSLNAYQTAGYGHPYTCRNRGDGRHQRTTDTGVLVATSAGWVCPDCDYRQGWAHIVTANWTWQRFIPQWRHA